MRRFALLLLALAALDSRVARAQAADSLLARPVGAFVALSVADIDAQARWYAEHLQLRVVHQGEALQGKVRFAILEGQGTYVELIQQRDGRTLQQLAPGIEGEWMLHGVFKAGLHVRDIEALHAQFVARGADIPYTLDVVRDLPGLRSFIVRDPERNMIQFFGR